MIKYLLALTFALTFLNPLELSSQVDDNDLSISGDERSEEDRKIDKAYKFLRTNREEEGYELAKEVYDKVTSSSGITRVNLFLGYYFADQNNIDSSLFYTNKAVELYTYVNDSLQNLFNSLTYDLFAINSRNKGLLEESKKWRIMGMEALEQSPDIRLYYVHMNGLAGVYLRLGDKESSLKLYKRCMEYKSDNLFVYSSSISISEIYSSQSQMDSALFYLEKAKYYCSLGDLDNCQVNILFNLAFSYQRQKKYEAAIRYYLEMIEACNDPNCIRMWSAANTNIGEVYKDLKQYSTAIYFLEKGLQQAQEVESLEVQEAVLWELKEVAVAQNKMEDAFNFLTDYQVVRDSVQKLQKDKTINELEVRYKTLQKEKEIEGLKKDKKLQQADFRKQRTIKNIILVSFFILLIPFIGLFITYYQKLQAQNELNIKQEEVNNEKIVTLKKEQELKLIKASIEGQDKERQRIAQELHDSIGGNLAAIKLQLSNLNVDGKQEFVSTINSQIDDTYEQVRDLSHNLIPKKFSKNDFCDVLEEYLSNLGLASNLKTNCIVYPKTEINNLNEDLQIEVFKIIQELITNTIKHSQADSVEMQLNLMSDGLNILFEDNGVGFDTKNHLDGIGFENIKSRLSKYNGSLMIDSMINRGTIINIEIPNSLSNKNEL